MSARRIHRPALAIRSAISAATLVGVAAAALCVHWTAVGR
jgi:hypothetical protein